MPELRNKVAHWTATTGTGALALEDALDGHFALRAADDGKKFDYVVNDGLAALDSEVGRGTYTHATRSLSRDKVYRSTDNDAKIRLSSNRHVVLLTPSAEALPPHGFVLADTYGGTGVTGSAWKSLTSDNISTEVYDLEGWLSTDGSDRWKFQPTEAGFYMVGANITFSSMTDGGYYVTGYVLNDEDAAATQEFVRGMAGNAGHPGGAGSTPVYMNGSTDYLTWVLFSSLSGTQVISIPILWAYRLGSDYT